MQAADVPQARVSNHSWMSAAEWQALHQANLAQRDSGYVRILFTGDSITRGWKAAGQAVWQRNYQPGGALNFGVNGDTTQNLLWRITRGDELAGLSPQVVVLMIGSNNFVYFNHSSAQVADGVRTIVDAIRVRVPTANIVVMGILPRGVDTDSRLQKNIRATNRRLARLDERDQVSFLDIGDRFLLDDGTPNTRLMHDAVHLTPEGYEIWAAALAPGLDKQTRE